MKTKSYILDKIRAVQQPSCRKPALLTLVLAAAILCVSACSDSDNNRDNNDSHDSNHSGNQGNHGNHMK